MTEEIKDIYFKNILVAVDDSDDAILAFKYAIHRAVKDDVGLTLVSILEPDDMNVFQALNKDFVHGKKEDLEKHLREYKQIATDAGVKKVHSIIATDDNPGEVIVEEVIPRVHPDLLIIGSKSKKGISKRFGSQAAYMAKYSPVSVLVVR